MKIIDKFYNNKKAFSAPLEEELDWNLVGSDRNSESVVHSILSEILNHHKNGKVGVVNGLEGGLTVDYINVDDNEEWRFIMGFTELGYWAYCNYPKSKLK